MDVELIKRIRHGTHIFEPGEKGEIVEVESPLKFHDKLIYHCYAKFPSYGTPVGLNIAEIKYI